MSTPATLVPLDPQAIERLIPQASTPAQQRRLDDLRIQTRVFVATILATVPAGEHRQNALRYLRLAVTAAVIGISAGDGR